MLVVSCTTKMILQEGYFFQSLVKEGSLTVTCKDPSILKNFVSASDSLINRVSRVNALITGSDFDAIIEAKVNKSLFKTGMLFSSDFNKVKGEDYYLSDNLKIGLKQKNLLLATNADYNKLSSSLDSISISMIDEPTATLMAEADLAVYSIKPKLFINLDFIASTFTTNGMDKLLILLSKDSLDLMIDFETEALANAFMKILKLGYVAKLKRQGVAFTIEQLNKVFIQENSKIKALGLIITEEEKQSIINAF